MKKLFALMFVAVLCLFLFACGKVPTPETHFKYDVEFGRATITEFDPKYQGEVVIPEKLGGYTVTRIGEAAFRECDALTSVTIPDGVTEIGIYAFAECESLAAITIPDSITSIGERAFYKCNSLTSVTIGNGVTAIGDYAFSYCPSLAAITIPSSVTKIGKEAFSFCDALTSIKIPNSITSIGQDAFWGCKLTIHAPAGSYAEKYAKENKFSFIAE